MRAEHVRQVGFHGKRNQIIGLGIQPEQQNILRNPGIVAPQAQPDG
jgi:hypothetical protein